MSPMPEPTALGPVARAGDSRVLVGTCSWTDPTLVKDTDWYPRKSMSAADRLAYYAAHYPIAEADGTFYYPPSPELTTGWVERTPPGFTMNVKAYSLLTGHATRPTSLWPDIREAIAREHAGKRNVYASHLDPSAVEEVWERFAFSLRPLADAGKLGAVLFQYPPWFTPRRSNRDELALLRARMGTTRVCVELRSPRWFGADDRDRTLGVLREHGLTLVVVDAPKKSGLETVLEVTTPELAVVRFHGRADDTWDARTATAAERFRYEYSRRELRAWVPKIQHLAEHADEVHALMNNCYQDYGVRNAADLQELLGAPA